MRSALLIAVSILLVAGCSGRQARPATQLTMLALNPYVGRAAFHLDCGPAGGDLADPAAACAAVRRRPELITEPKPYMCMGGTSSWWDVTISGRLDGRTIRRAFSTCWTPQMATLGRLGMSWWVLRKHLLPRRHQAVPPGAARTFAAGWLRPADLVSCDILGHHLEVGVPVQRGPDARAGNGYGGAGIVSVTLTVVHHRDGSVAASCHTERDLRGALQ
jgi:hypothetical protein